MNFESNCNRLKKWIDENQSYPTIDDNPELYRFVRYARDKAGKGKLGNYELKLLVDMKFVFHAREAQWENKFLKFQEYIKSSGGKYPRALDKKNIKEYDQTRGVWLSQKRKEEFELGVWMVSQRENINNGNIRSDRKALLESINFEMSSKKVSAAGDEKWLKNFQRFKQFLKLTGGRYPSGLNRNEIEEYDKEKGVWLSLERKEEYLLKGWVQTQKREIKNGTIESSRRTLLDSIKFKVDFPEDEEAKWKENFQRFQKFLNSNQGSYPRRVRKGRIKEYDQTRGVWLSQKRKEEHLLFNWVNTQRNNIKKSTIDPDRKALLDSIDFKMDLSSSRDEKWKEKFHRFQEFIKSNGGKYPRRTKRKDIKEYDQLRGIWLSQRRKEEHLLRYWVRKQRENFKNETIKPDRKALLDSINFRWE